MYKQSLPLDARHWPPSRWPREGALAPGWLLAVTLLFPGGAHAQNPTFSISIQNDRFVPSELDVPARQKIKVHVKKLLNDALEKAEASPVPDPATLLEGVYATPEDLDTPHHK